LEDRRLNVVVHVTKAKVIKFRHGLEFLQTVVIITFRFILFFTATRRLPFTVSSIITLN